MTDTDAAVIFLVHDGLKQTQILKQRESQNPRVVQIGKLVTPVQTEMHNFGTTPPKTLDNWDYQPTACKLRVTLLFSADSSEKEILPQWWVVGLRWIYCITLLSHKKITSFSISWLGEWPWRGHAEERRGTAPESGPPPLHQQLQYVGLSKHGSWADFNVQRFAFSLAGIYCLPSTHTRTHPPHYPKGKRFS